MDTFDPRMRTRPSNRKGIRNIYLRVSLLICYSFSIGRVHYTSNLFLDALFLNTESAQTHNENTKSACYAISNHLNGHNETFCTNLRNAHVIQKAEEANQPASSKKKYLQYFAPGAWANQVNSLIIGYWFALATDRVLIVPPRIPRNQANQLVYTFIHPLQPPIDSYAKSLLSSSELIRIIYAEQKPSREMIEKLNCSYTEKMNYTRPFFNYTTDDLVSIDEVVDLDYMLPNVEHIDLHDFYADHWTENMTDWVMNYTHLDTIFVKNQKTLENKQRGQTTYRDISTIGREYSQYDVWTIYDTMQLGTTGAVHSSVFEYHKNFDRYNMRFNEPVRVAARKAHEKFGCIPYVSIHIRATEYKFQPRLQRTIMQVMGNVETATTHWLNTTGETPEKIGFFILTDWPELFEMPLFEQQLMRIKANLFGYHDIELVVLAESGNRIAGYNDIVMHLGKSMGVEEGEASMYLAQQVAACGAIGFFGTIGSTFSTLVENIRKSPCAC